MLVVDPRLRAAVVLGPPSLALLYAAAAHAFLASFHDRPWASRGALLPILVRAAACAVAAAAALAFAFAFASVPAPASASRPASALLPSDGPTAPIAVAASLSAASSAWLASRTRRIEVLGETPDLEGMLEGGRMSGRVVMITGASGGIGRETARTLLAAGATVIAACRSEGRARGAMEDILASVAASAPPASGPSEERGGAGRENPRDRLLFLKLDLSDLSSVRSAVGEFREMGLPLHVLINNAGLMMSRRHTSVDGFELTMAANHLGHFLLTNLLLPYLRKNDDARVVTVASQAYTMNSGSGIDLDDLNCERRPYSLFGQYSQTKLANILFGRELARREVSVASHVVHPGIVRTNVVRNMPWYLYYPNIIFGALVSTLQKTPEAGAYTSVWCAASDDLIGQSGGYYMNSAPAPLEAVARDDEAAEKLWALSEKLVGLV